MADLYGVTPAQIAGEMPQLAPVGGFSSVTVPKLEDVIEYITEADTAIRAYILERTGVTPDPATDASAPLAKRYIAEHVAAQIMRKLYEGLDPLQVEAIWTAQMKVANSYRDMIKNMGSAAVGPPGTVPESGVRGGAEFSERDLVVNDAMLDNN